jgi:hypothetical protein
MSVLFAFYDDDVGVVAVVVAVVVVVVVVANLWLDYIYPT